MKIVYKFFIIVVLMLWTVQGNAQTSAIPTFNWFKFTKDLDIGLPDIYGEVIGGTEVMWIVAHKGKLFSATSYWNNVSLHGPQMLIKESSQSKWRVQYTFPQNVVRNDALNSFIFKKDRYGNLLEKPDTLLIASLMTQPYGEDKNIRIWTRIDSSNTWVPSSNLDTNLNVQDSYIRSFTFHTDSKTGIEYIFAGGANGKLYKGSYDASLPNKIYWDSKPEIIMTSGERFHSGAVCNGRLYISGGRNIQKPEEGGVYLRTDGENPSWKRVYIFPEKNNQSMRALTAVPNPKNPNSQVLVGTREIAGLIERIVPMPNDTVEIMLEMDIRQSFINTWGSLGGQVALCAYNRLEEGFHPTTGEKVWFLGLNIKHTNPQGTPEFNNAYTLMRDLNGNYQYCMVVDSAILIPPGVGLKSVRTMMLSPFPEDSNRVYFLGGFDGANGPHQNTAWIYKAVDLSFSKPLENTFTSFLNIQYDSIENVDKNLLSLDIYKPNNISSLAPVVVYVHGGSWRVGDKSSVRLKPEFFTKQGYILISVNYRLSPNPPDTNLVDAVRFPDHPRDIAKAISWVYKNIHFYGGDKNRIGLTGHSAGGHIAAVVATNPSFLLSFGVPVKVPCVCMYDAAAYNIPRLVAFNNTYSASIKNAMGNDPDLWDDASPALQIRNNPYIGEWVLFSQEKGRTLYDEAVLMQDTLKNNGYNFPHYPLALEHDEINGYVGIEDSIQFQQLLKDYPFEPSPNALRIALAYTDSVESFFRRCFSKITSVNETAYKYRIIIHPNPASVYIEINLDKVILSEAKNPVKIYNTFGECVMNDSIHPMTPSHRMNIDHLPAGLYFIQIGNYSEKFMVVR
jgi:hypothetical protein